MAGNPPQVGGDPLDLTILAKQALNVLVAISFLAMIAMGLYVIFNLMRVINMAHGDLLMIGAYVQLTLTGLGLNFWLGVILSVMVTAAMGMVVERLLLRSLYVRGELTTLLATWGLSIVLQQSVRFLYGSQTQYIGLPLTSPFTVGRFSYPLYHLVIMLLTWMVLGLTIWLLLRTRFGIAVRATMDHTAMAGAVGIPTSTIFLLAFGLGAGLAGLAGALLAPILGILPTMGLDFVAKSFFVVIVGGTGSVFSTLGGAGVIAGFENVLTAASNPVLAQILVLLLVIAIMYLRPEGLFSRIGRRGGV